MPTNVSSLWKLPLPLLCILENLSSLRAIWHDWEMKRNRENSEVIEDEPVSPGSLKHPHFLHHAGLTLKAASPALTLPTSTLTLSAHFSFLPMGWWTQATRTTTHDQMTLRWVQFPWHITKDSTSLSNLLVCFSYFQSWALKAFHNLDYPGLWILTSFCVSIHHLCFIYFMLLIRNSRMPSFSGPHHLSATRFDIF